MPNPRSHNDPDPEPTTLSELLPLDTTTQLLSIAIAEPRRPIDQLIDRLDDAGMPWLLAALASGPLEGMGAPEAVLAAGRSSVEDLGIVKKRSKALLRTNGEQRLAGIAGYFLALAAGLRDHGVLLTSRSVEELRPLLIDLASALDGPLQTLLVEAARVEPAKPGA
jgi:hypothetical protein